MLNLLDAARASDFFVDFPFYTATQIPAGTYTGVEQIVETYQDNTILVSHKGVDSKIVYATMNVLFNEQTIKTLRDKYPIAHDFELKKSLQGIIIPLHPEALKFWQEQGLIQ